MFTLRAMHAVIIGECLSARQLFLQCTQVVFVCKYMYFHHKMKSPNQMDSTQSTQLVITVVNLE